MRERELNQREWRKHVRLVRVSQLLEGVERQERERRRAQQTSVVDEKVDRVAGCLNEPAPVVGISDVAADRRHAGEAADRMLERIHSPRVNGELPAALGESTGEREPEAARCAGDDRPHSTQGTS
jgi:hypothetical protein